MRTITPEQFAEQTRRIAAAAPKALKKGLMAGAARALTELQARTRAAAPANPSGVGEGGAVDTGRFLRSWKSRAISDGVRVLNDAPYAAIVEHGRRAGAAMPPIGTLGRWAARRIGGDAPDAFVIARAIARRGLKGRGILAGALPRLRAMFVEELSAEASKLLIGSL